MRRDQITLIFCQTFFNFCFLNIPPDLLHSLAGTPGFDESSFVRAHGEEPAVSIRFNPSRFKKEFTDLLPLEGRVPWCEQGYYLKNRPSFTLDPLFHAGVYYVQEPSSMFLAHALSSLIDLSVPLRVLDLCASPGGKSTLLQSLISRDSLLVSNEVIKGRAGVLCENLSRWGAANVVVTQNDAADFAEMEHFFDVLVVDAPCSGSGLYRKEPEAIDEWSSRQVLLCAARQKRILADALPSLAPGGTLVYSTCSYSMEENEAISRWLRDEQALEPCSIACPSSWNIVATEESGVFGYRFYPDRLRGEGFFLSAFRKPSNPMLQKKNEKKGLVPADQRSRYAASAYCLADHLFSDNRHRGFVILPPAVSSCFGQLQGLLHVCKAGVRAGEMMHEEWIPDHELALSEYLSAAVRRIELDRPTALDYLRRQTIEISDMEKGWAVVCYSGVPLGWIKGLGSRINNYYPKNWRILNK